MKRGFTLVELSIVLVIIGLLIGGILVAQSLIDSAKIQSFTRQIGQYDAAVGVFVGRYNNLPGDNILFDSTDTTVNGLIEDADGGSNSMSGEIGQFWKELSLTGLKNDNGSGFVDMMDEVGIDRGEDSPAIDLGINTSIIAISDAGANYYQASQFLNDTASTIATGASLTTQQAISIDIKLDDGDGSSGNIVDTLYINSFTPFTFSSDSTACASGGNYDMTNEGVACQISIRLGASTGNLK